MAIGRSCESQRKIDVLISGFRLIDREVGILAPASRLWTVIEVAYGHTTDWRLRITLEDGVNTFTVWFNDQTSFRVLDEREILGYWSQRDLEKIEIGTLYSIVQSPFLKEMQEGVSAQILNSSETLTHYLLAGMDNCVEVLSTHPPVVEHLHATR